MTRIGTRFMCLRAPAHDVLSHTQATYAMKKEIKDGKETISQLLVSQNKIPTFNKQFVLAEL